MKTDPALSPGVDKTLVLIIKYTIDIPNLHLSLTVKTNSIFDFPKH